MKHIEQIQPEVAAGELSRLLVADADATATAALTRLLHDWTGCDIPQTDTTPESEVEELVPLCLSILRRHWTTPLTALGDGNTPMSLADLMRRLIGDRVQGNEAWCIPPANDNIPTAVAALLERKIGGVPEAPDGVSLPRLLCDSTIPPITELIDDNIGWVMDRNLRDISVEKIRLNCVAAHNKYIVSNNSTNGGNITSVKTLELPELEEMLYLTTHYNNDYMGIIVGDVPIEHLYLPKFKRCKYHPDSRQRPDNVWVVGGSNYIKEIHAPELTNAITNNSANGAISNCSVLRSCIIPKYIGVFDRLFMNCPQLIHVEVCVEQNINLNKWIPTMALRTDTTAEDYVDLREDMSFANNLEQFLYNFQTYIADRAIDRTGQSALTLTLSAEVYASLEQQDGQTILATLTNKNWTVTTA